MMPLKAWRIVGAQKHWLHPLAFAPLLPARPPAPPPPRKHSSCPIFLGLGQAEPSTGVLTRPLPAHGSAPLWPSPVRVPLSCSLSSEPWRSAPQGPTERSIAGTPP